MPVPIDLDSGTKVCDGDTLSLPVVRPYITCKRVKSTSSHFKCSPEGRNSSEHGSPVEIDSIPLSTQLREGPNKEDEDLSSIPHPPGKPWWLITAGTIFDVLLLLVSLLFIGLGILAKCL